MITFDHCGWRIHTHRKKQFIKQRQGVGEKKVHEIKNTFPFFTQVVKNVENKFC